MKHIRVYQREPEIYTLGPGRRYCLWVQGCDRRCPGCVSAPSRDREGGTLMTTGALSLEIRLSGAEGLTISGGEPFLQAEALTELLQSLHETVPDMGVIVYTGYTLEQLHEVPFADGLLQYIDLLIDGPYLQEQDDGKSLRGSSNQRVIPLSQRYNTPEVLQLYGQDTRTVQVLRHGSGISLVGVINEKDTNYREAKT